MTNRYTRRGMLAAGVAGVAAAVAGCSTRGGNLDSQLEEVRSETESYQDPSAAIEAGFQLTGPVAPGQGWHFVNPDRIQAAAQDGVSRDEPQVLTYDTEMNLIAVEWAVPADAVEEPPDLFDDDGADATEEWHTHQSATHVLATGNGQADDPSTLGMDAMATNANWAAFMPPNPDLSPGDEVALEWGTEKPAEESDGETRVVDVAATHPAIETLHVWVHEDNPEGVFNPVHPDVAGGGDHEH